MLTVVDLVKCVTQHPSNLCARRIQHVQLSFDGFQLGIITVNVRQSVLIHHDRLHLACLPQDHFRRHSPFGSFSMLRPPATVLVMADTPLPGPESERLAALVGGGSLRLVYGLLYRRRDHPPTAKEIAFFLQAASADAPVSSVIRGLREYFEISIVVLDGEERYQLRGWAGSRPMTDLVPISARLKAQALASGRCELCGKTPRHHNVVLEVDLRVPADWGGTNDPENLWALCEDCHVGWRQYLQTYAPYAEQISRKHSRPAGAVIVL